MYFDCFRSPGLSIIHVSDPPERAVASTTNSIKRDCETLAQASASSAQITPGGLLFNDTAHCAPLHPHHLYRLRAGMGLLRQARTDGTRPLWIPGRFFEIPIERIRQISWDEQTLTD